MKPERTKEEIAELQRLCARAIWFTPKIGRPNPTESVTMAQARKRAKALVHHCLAKPVTADG